MKYNNHNLCLLFVLFAGCLSLGWIDPLADKVREGNRLYQAGKYDEALGQYVDAQLNAPASPQLDFNTADVQYKRGKFDAAARLFGKVLKSDDAAMKAKSCFNMGNTLYRQGKMEDALEHYKKTLDYVDGVAPGSNEFETLKHDAQYNYEYVKKKMKEQEQKQQDKNKEDQQQKEDPNKKDDKPDQEKGENKDPEKENQDSPKNDEQRQKPENKPETGEDHKDEKQEQPENDRQKNQRQDQPQGQQPPQHQEKQQMSREEAERLLEALNQSEKEARATIKDAHRAQHRPVEKDW